MKNHVSKLIFLTYTLALLGCKAEHFYKEPNANAQNKLTTISFEEVKERVLKPYCISCHENRHNGFESYELVRATSADILQRISTTNSRQLMPPTSEPVLPIELKTLLTEWIQAGAPRTATKPTPLPLTTTFQMVKEKVLKPSCIGCHSQFNDFHVVKDNLVSIYSFIMDGTMPFPRKKGQTAEPMSLEQMNVLNQWVAEGAPYSLTQPDLPQKEDELKPTWISLRNKVLGPKCLLCHNSFGSRAPTSMGTFRELQSWWREYPQLFDLNDPEKSHFIGAILGRVNEETDEFFYDPMPFNSPTDDVQKDIPSVTESELLVIQKWIELGLPYDEED